MSRFKQAYHVKTYNLFTAPQNVDPDDYGLKLNKTSHIAIKIKTFNVVYGRP